MREDFKAMLDKGGPWLDARVIGDCLMLHGDCLGIIPELGEIESIVTDPPYGMSFKSNYRKVETSHRAIDNDGTTELLEWACGIKAMHSSYVWMRWDNIYNVPKPKSLITWVKNNWSMGDLNHEHGRQTEVCAFYAGDNHGWGSGRPPDVVMLPRTGNTHHPTEKPVGLMESVVSWTKSDVILDPFIGSGATGVACVKTGRAFIGIELDADYYEIASKRVEEAYKQPDMFIAPPPPPPKQDAFDL